MLTDDLKTRARMYLWVTLLCGATAAMMQLFLAGTGEIRTYAERQLDDSLRARAHQEVAYCFTNGDPPMTSTMWYCGLLESLPRDSKRRLSSELRRSIRSGSLPSRRAWKASVSEEMYGYRARG